jgi:hypothetical protein
MKQKLTLLLIALFTTVGAWADDVLPASSWNISSALPTEDWPAMGENTPSGVSGTAYYRTQTITLETKADLLGIKFLYSTGKHRLDILGVDALDGENNVVASDYHVGYTGGNMDKNQYFLKNLPASTYTLRYIIGTGPSDSKGNITIIKYDAEFIASLPQLTTDVNNPKYYSIASYDRGGYLKSNGSGEGLTHVDFAAGSAWYFTAVNGNNSGSVLGGVIANCSDGTKMTTGWKTAATGGTVYILSNGVNTNGFSISKTAVISSWSCCDANNTNTGVGNWNPSSDDWKGTTWVIEPTVPIGPTGYYYFKGMDTTRNPYLYSDFVTKGSVATYHHDWPSTPSNGHIWKVTNEGTTFTLTNGEGLPLTTTPSSDSSVNNPHETLTLSAASAGPDYYFTEAINLTNWGNDTRLTTWEGHPDANDNKWTFEPADVSAGIYNVVILGNDAGYVTYSGQNAKNGGFFVASSIAVDDLTAYDIDGYSEVVSVEGRTITVSYNQLLSYTLTDANGATYEGTYNGAVGVTPTFTGCSGYTLTDGSWSGTAYSATINFPFAVSSNNVENQTFLGAFHTKSGYTSEDFLWHASGTSVIVHNGDIPDETQEEQQKYQWLVKPSITDLNITFTIKNVSTGKYIYSTTDSPSHTGAVSLSETASPLTYSGPLSLPSGSTSTATSIYAFIVSSTNLYLSVSSVLGGVDSQLGVHNVVHDGISVGFHTFADLISRYWAKNNIAAEIAKAGQYGYPAPNEENTVYLLWVKGAMERDIFDGTVENYNSLLTWHKGFLAADVVTPAAGDFLRIKASDTNKSAWSLSGSNLYLTSSNCASKTDRAGFVEGATATDNTTIFYYNGTTLTGFANGLQPIKDNNNQMQIGTAGATSTDVSFEVINNTEQHAFRVEFNNNGRSLYTQRGGSSGSYYYHTDAAGGNATESHYRYFLEKVTSLPVTVSSAKYATLYAPVALTIPTGVQAYYISSLTSTEATLTEITGTIPAETPVILYADVNEATTFNFNITTADAFSGTNKLEGRTVAFSVSADDVTNKAYYTLQQNVAGDAVGLFPKTAAGSIAGFKAYLPATNFPTAGVKGFTFVFDEDDATGIKTIDNEQLTIDNEIYNLAGQRLNKMQKGINIVNGKKVLK